MAAAAEISRGDEIQCAFCFSSDSDMNDPRRLPCGHVSCLKGIQDDFAANKILQCPKCRKAYGVSPEDLPTHDPTGTQISGQLCDACIEDHGRAAVYCIKCAKKLCKTHEKHHEDIYPNHKSVLSIWEYDKQVDKLTPKYCKSHNEQPLVLACQQCLDRFCIECEDTSEVCLAGQKVNHHKIVTVKKLSAQKRDDLLKLKAMAEDKESEYKEFAKEYTDVLDKFDVETKCLALKIQKTREEQFADLQKKYAELDEDLVTRRERTRGEITDFMEAQIMEKLKSLYQNIRLIDTTIQDSHEVDVIGSFTKREAAIEELVSHAIANGKTFNIPTVVQGEECRDIELRIDQSDQKVAHKPAMMARIHHGMETLGVYQTERQLSWLIDE